MVSSDNLCMSCMREIGNEKKCPHCGFHVDTAQNSPFLPIRTVVANRYLIGRLIEFYGEGATYIGWDLKEKKAVNIREFMPDTFTTRTAVTNDLRVMLGSEGTFAELRRSFEELWVKLAQLNGLSAMICVTDVFEDNSTSYAVYDHVDGISLRDFLLRSKTGYIPWEKARQLLMPTLSTLGTLHNNGIIHRGISPTTLMIGEDGKLKITGFSISEVRTVGSRLNPQIFDGYAAAEQYGFDARQGPWTDIYAFGGVLYRTLIGSDPISAKERMTNDQLMVPGKFAEIIPAYVINGLINALQILPKDRTKTVEQLRADLSASPTAVAPGVTYVRGQEHQPIHQQVPAQPPVDKKKRKPMSAGKIVALTAIPIVLIGVIAVTLVFTVFKDRLNFNINFSETQVSTLSNTTLSENVEVPDFYKKYFNDIVANPVYSNNFRIEKDEIYDENVPEGYVIAQNIPAGNQVERKSIIILTVSKGTEKIRLPDVEGADYEDAASRLSDVGFTVQRVETDQGGRFNNEVVSMSLTENQEYPIGTKVVLKVYISPDASTLEQDDEDDYGQVGPDFSQEQGHTYQ